MRTAQTPVTSVHSRPLKSWVEETSVAPHGFTASEYCQLPENTKSTISISFNADGSAFASSHGDHTIKIIDSETFAVLHTLVGHPRTPWSVKCHPTDLNCVASGCLAGNVRIWDIGREQTIHLIVVENAIISMSFHPFENLLALVVVNQCMFWKYEKDEKAIVNKCDAASQNRSVESTERNPPVMRCVMFTRDGKYIVIGETNGPVKNFVSSADSSNLTAIRLVLYEYVPEVVALRPPGEWSLACVNPRVITETALLYNCGGVDFSPCSTKLVACIVDDRLDEDGTRDQGVVRSHRRDVRGGKTAKSAGKLDESFSLSSPKQDSGTDGASDNGIKVPPFLRRAVRRRASTPYKVAIFSLESRNFGSFIMTAPLSKSVALGVTSVKFSPSASFIILGCGARPAHSHSHPHPAIVSIYRCEDMKLTSNMRSERDDLNIALFHPSPGNGFYYGTRHGKIRRVLINNLR